MRRFCLTSTAMASKKTTKVAPKAKTSKKTRAKPAVNKSEFIRSNASLPPQEIVAKAKKQGFDLSIAMVYTILSEYRKKQGKGKAPKAKSSSTTTITTGAAKPSGSLESTLIDAVVDLGGKTVQELLQTAIAKVKATAKK